MVTREELSALLQSHGWYLDMVKKYKTEYAYAKRRQGTKVQTRYISTENKLANLSETDILQKIEEREAQND